MGKVINMRKKRYFQRIYEFDEASKTYLIKVSLDDYNDVYDDWDHSPFKKRDIEHEFNDYIANSSEDIPLQHSISIVLYLPALKKNDMKETALISAYQNYYSYGIERLKKTKFNLNKRTLLHLMLSLFLLSIGSFFIGDQNVFFKVLHEGIFIGGWVFLWEFFTNITITTREMQNEYRLYNRLYHAEIRFIYEE